MLRLFYPKIAEAALPAFRLLLAPRRNLWGSRISGPGSFGDRFKRHVFVRNPWWKQIPRITAGGGVANAPYRIDVNLRGYTQIHIEVFVKDGALVITAKKEFETKTGNKHYKELEEKWISVLLPKYVDERSLRYFIYPEGVLTVEIPYKT